MVQPPIRTRITLRPLEPEDADLVREVFDHLGPTSRYQRFLVPKHRLTSTDLRQLTSVDHCCHEAVIAFVEPGHRPVGIARFHREREDPGVAEIAVEVVDAWQLRGIGGLLTEALVARALDLRVRQLSALVADGNTGATRLLRRVPGRLGRVETSYGAAEYRVVLPAAC
jgi:RimJ/RimL family protein N-acetyltransferase